MLVVACRAAVTRRRWMWRPTRRLTLWFFFSDELIVCWFVGLVDFADFVDLSSLLILVLACHLLVLVKLSLVSMEVFMRMPAGLWLFDRGAGLSIPTSAVEASSWGGGGWGGGYWRLPLFGPLFCLTHVGDSRWTLEGCIFFRFMLALPNRFGSIGFDSDLSFFIRICLIWFGLICFDSVSSYLIRIHPIWFGSTRFNLDRPNPIRFDMTRFFCRLDPTWFDSVLVQIELVLSD